MIGEYLNTLTAEKALEALMRCCGSTQWAQAMVTSRPFRDDAMVLERAQTIWEGLTREDFLEAFSHHPQIGASRAALEKKFPATHTWSSQEQSGMHSANSDIIERLLVGNKRYLDTFGYIFIVCASGKSAEEMCL